MHSWTFIVAAQWNEQSVDRHDIPLRHIILISSQSVFALNSVCLLEEKITISVFGMPWLRIKPMIYHTDGKHTNKYITEVIVLLLKLAMQQSYNKFQKFQYYVTNIKKFFFNYYVWTKI
jgi:hypothetical protein